MIKTKMCTFYILFNFYWLVKINKVLKKWNAKQEKTSYWKHFKNKVLVAGGTVDLN